MSETAGWHAYALFTDAALEHMGIPLDAAHVQTENYEHLGEVRTHSFNLQERYRALTEARRVFLDEKDADFTFVRKISAPPTIVWTWANDPNKRNACAATPLHWRPGDRPKGRTGVGARNHCAHGKGESTETILDWRPFDYFTTESQGPSMKGVTMKHTYQFVPMDGGRALVSFMLVNMFKMRDMMNNLARMAEDEYRMLSNEAIPAAPQTTMASQHAHELN